MSGSIEQLECGCLCGAVRFIATGQRKGIYWCHCQSCRRHTGAPVAVFAVFDCEAYRVTKGEITKFDSTPRRTRRGFCAVCGSTLKVVRDIAKFSRPAERIAAQKPAWLLKLRARR